MTPSSPPLSRSAYWYRIAAGIAALAVIVVIVAILVHNRSSKKETPVQVTSPSPSPSASNPNVVPVSPTATNTTASPTASPTATASPTGTTLPASAQTVVANFYTAYGNKDSAKLRAFFTPDSTQELKDQNSTLFTGYDTKGRPGGPILFADPNWSQYVVSHQITTVAAQGTGWVVTVSEQRKDASGTTSSATTTLTLLPDPTSSWLIDAYAHVGSTGKYNGFFTQ